MGLIIKTLTEAVLIVCKMAFGSKAGNHEPELLIVIEGKLFTSREKL